MRRSDDFASEAVKAAALATGLREDQIERAVAEYRAASEALHQEPEWRSVMHMSGAGSAIAQYADPSGSTAVCLQIESYRERGDWVQYPNVYTFAGKPYETFGEARAVELKATTKPKPHAVSPSPAAVGLGE